MIRLEVGQFIHEAMRAYRPDSGVLDWTKQSTGGVDVIHNVIQRAAWYQTIHLNLTRNVLTYVSDVTSMWEAAHRRHIDLIVLDEAPRPRPTLFVGDSDVHEGGRFSIGIGEPNLIVAVHKPRPNDAEYYLCNVLKAIFPAGEFYVPPLSALSANSMLQEYVPSSGYYPSDERSFFFCYGQYVALCQLIGLADQHVTNLISSSSGVAVIDGETIFASPTGQPEKIIRTDVGVLGYWDTPLFTCLLPVYTKEPRTMAPRLAETLIGSRISRSALAASELARLAEIVVEGYQEFINRIHDHTNRACELINGLGYITSRTILRTTSSYALLQRLAAMRTGFGTLANFETALLQIFSLANPPFAHQHEVDAILRGEIPTSWDRVSESAAVTYINGSAGRMKENIRINTAIIERCCESLQANRKEVDRLLSDADFYDLRR